MKSTNFDYICPSSLEEVIQILDQYQGEVKIISGGQSLMPILNYRLASPQLLVDLQGVADLNKVSISSEGTTLGARVRWVDIENHDGLRVSQPLLCAAIDHVAHYQIRNRGTVGGSLVHADPAAEMPGLAVALEGILNLHGPQGVRRVHAADFFLGQLSTSIENNEILVSIELPFWPQDRRWGFAEFSRRKGDFALAGAAVWFDLASDGHAMNVHIGLIGTGEKPMRLLSAESGLNGLTLTESMIESVVHQSLSAMSFQGDIHASEKYRRALMLEMVSKAFAQAMRPIN
jgi:aerobic carbon-monoxide dehydrogenase medium subunit